MPVELPIFPKLTLNSGLLRPVGEIAAGALQRLNGLVVDRIDNHHSILRRARRRIIERLRCTDFLGSRIQVSRFVDNHRHIACADTNGRRTARISPADVILRSCHKNQVDRFHQCLGGIFRHRIRENLNQILRQTDLRQSFPHIIHDHLGRAVSQRRRCNDHRVTPLDRHHRLVDRRRAGIGRRRNRTNHSDRLGELHNAPLIVAFDFTNGFRPQQIAKGAKRLALLLDDLVGHIAETRVFHRKFGKGLRVFRIVKRPRDCADRLVRSRLIRFREDFLRDPRAAHEIGCDLLRVRGPALHFNNGTHVLTPSVAGSDVLLTRHF